MVYCFLSLKCRCYLFKRGEWQAISLVNFPTLCKPSCCLILPGDLLHNHHSQKRSQGHVNLVICLWWNFNQHTMKVSLVRSHWPDFLRRFQQSSVLKGQKNMPDTATYLGWSGEPSSSVQPATQPSVLQVVPRRRRSWCWALGLEALMHFGTTRKRWLPGAGQGASERQLFLWVFKFFDSPAHPGSPISSVMASSSAVQAVFIFSSPWYDIVSYLSTHREDCCSSSITGIQTAESCSCLWPGGKILSCS